METLTFITLGESGVGKTTFLVSATKERACTEIQLPTLGLDFFHRKFHYGGKEYSLNFRDTGGSEEFRAVTQQYVRGCDGAFIMFDEKNSLMKDLEYWRVFYEFIVDDAEWVLVKTKSDSKSERNMDCTPFVKFAREHRKPFFEVSAREYKGVEEALEALVARALHRRERMATQEDEPNTSVPKRTTMNSKAEQTNRDVNYRTGDASNAVIIHVSSTVANSSDNKGNCRC